MTWRSFLTPRIRPISLCGDLDAELEDDPLASAQPVGDAGTWYPPLTHGGVGVDFSFEDTGTIDDVRVDPPP